jgi:hypothetical protein
LSLIVLFLGVIAYRLKFDPSITGIDKITFVDTVKYIFYQSYRLRALWIIIALVVTWLNWRRTRFRMSEKEIHRDNTSGLS